MLAQTDIPPAPGVPEPRLRFGSVAELYDRVRPDCPDDLLDLMLEYGHLLPGDRALDVGAGTGQASMQLAARGLSVLALDPSAEMTDVADGKFSEAELDARAVTGEFESARLDEHAFSLICAATSWHWLDPAVRFTAAARAIAPGGTLAVLWTWPRWRSTELCPEFDEIYTASGAPLEEMGPMCPLEPDPGALAREWVRDTQASGVFGEPEGKLCSWTVTYTARDYTDLLATYGDHIGLGPAVREPLLEAIRSTIDDAGATIELPYKTLLLLARAQTD